MKSLFYLLVTLLIYSPSMGHSFALKEHAEITRIAFDEFFRCVESPADDLKKELRDSAVEGVLREDTQYLRKSLQYSHFYHPKNYVNAKFAGRIDRCPSNYRMKTP